MSAYATFTQLRERIGRETPGDDLWLEYILDEASRAIDRACNRPDDYFLADAAASARVYAGSGQAVQWIDECVAVTLVEVKDSVTDDDYTAWESTDWRAGRGDPKSRPDFNHTPYQWLVTLPNGDYSYFTGGAYRGLRGFRPDPDLASHEVPTVRVTARWGGYATTPVQIRGACLMQSARWYKRYQSAWADAVASADFGTLLYRQSLDPDIALILERGRFMRPSIG